MGRDGHELWKALWTKGSVKVQRCLVANQFAMFKGKIPVSGKLLFIGYRKG